MIFLTTLWRSYTTRTFAAVILAIALANWHLNRTIFDEVLRMLVVGFMANLAIAFTPLAWACFRTPGWPNREAIGGFCWWFLGVCGTISGLTSAFYRMASRPGWVLLLPTTNAWAYGLIAIGLAGMFGPRFFADGMEPAVKRAIGGSWTAVAVAILIIIIARPDFTPMANWIEIHWIRPRPQS